MGRVLEYVLLGTLVLGLFTFIIMYMIGSNWRETLVGRYLLYFIMTIAGTFFYLMVSALIRNEPWKIYVDFAILILLNYGAWKLTWLLHRIQKGAYKDE